MIETELQKFLHAFRVQKRILIFLVFVGWILIVYLLFYGRLPETWVRSWLLIPSLLFTMMSVLGLVRSVKKIRFYESVFKDSQPKNGLFTLLNSNELNSNELKSNELNSSEKRLEEDFVAKLEFERELWELYLYPPNFDTHDMKGKSQNVEVLLDNENKPTILVTPSGCFFTNSSRLTLRK